MATPHKVTAEFWDHATLWSDDEHDAGHTTDGGRVFGITRTRYVECDNYACKPVYVVNPEDRDQMDRLAETYRAMGDGFAELMDEPWSLPAMRMRQTLRALLTPPTPPKPDEPTGLGAVVEDAAGLRYIRIDIHDDDATWVDERTAAFFSWLSVPAVRVLSQGVTP